MAIDAFLPEKPRYTTHDAYPPYHDEEHFHVDFGRALSNMRHEPEHLSFPSLFVHPFFVLSEGEKNSHSVMATSASHERSTDAEMVGDRRNRSNTDTERQSDRFFESIEVVSEPTAVNTFHKTFCSFRDFRIPIPNDTHIHSTTTNARGCFHRTARSSMRQQQADGWTSRDWLRCSLGLLVVAASLDLESNGYSVLQKKNTPTRSRPVPPQQQSHPGPERTPSKGIPREPIEEYTLSIETLSSRTIENPVTFESLSGNKEELGNTGSCPFLSRSESNKSHSESSLTFSPLEAWCVTTMDRWYASSQSLRCPFFRRRLGDALDTLEGLVTHLVIRNTRKHLLGPPQAHKPQSRHPKRKGLSSSELSELLRQDWKADTNHKGYYVTGRLTTGVYRDDCLFLGPDPDLPLRGLRKYVGVAAHLFEYPTSVAVLESLEEVPVRPEPSSESVSPGRAGMPSHPGSSPPRTTTRAALVAHWRLEGVLRLPWKPRLPKLRGRTIYHVDEEGLIACHEESWDCSATKAFGYTFLPALAHHIWREPGQDSSEEHP